MYIAGQNFNNYLPGVSGERSGNPCRQISMDYGFTVLNLYKLYLIVDKEMKKRFTFTASLAFRLKVN